jgi:hypothetical protein
VLCGDAKPPLDCSNVMDSSSRRHAITSAGPASALAWIAAKQPLTLSNSARA